MSETASTRTKTLTESSATDASLNLSFSDRWSNNISYRHLVASSCIGIVQLWWHPYLHDLKKLIPFLFLYNVFSIVIGYPMFYLELAIGVATRKGVVNCWDLAPVARGVAFAMIVTCILTVLVVSTVASWSLALFVHSFHSFLPWLHCVATAQSACAARHRPLPPAAETPAQSFFFNYVLKLKRNGLDSGMGTVVWEIALYFTISWVVIYFIAVKRIYSYSKLVLFKDVLAYFVLICCCIGSLQLKGGSYMFRMADWNILLTDFQLWQEAIEYALIEMTVSQGSLIMLGSYCPKQQHKLGRTAMLAFSASKSSSMLSAMTLGAAHGALQKDYENVTDIWKGPSASMILWSDYVARIPGSQFWSALVFGTLFVLAVTSAGLLVQTVISTLTGHYIRKISWAFLVMMCILSCFIGILTLCTQGGLYVLSCLLTWPVVKNRAAIAALTASIITYIYGQTTFCEDVYFTVGEYPSVFLRVCWALIPVILVVTSVASVGFWPPLEGMVGWVMVQVSMSPVLLVAFFYIIFRCRIRNIVSNVK